MRQVTYSDIKDWLTMMHPRTYIGEITDEQIQELIDYLNNFVLR